MSACNIRTKWCCRFFFLLLAGVLIGVVAYSVMPQSLTAKVESKVSKGYRSLRLRYILYTERGKMRTFLNQGQRTGKEAYIAHGGGEGEFVYTNCKEAIYDSVDKGFRYIELDLQETADGDLIAAHDWESFAEMTGNPCTPSFKQLPVAELKKFRLRSKFTILSSEDICQFLEQNPHVILVTDKIGNFELLMKRIPYPERMIVEVFSRDDYLKALEAGIRYPAYSMWHKDCMNEAEKYNFPLAVLPAHFLSSSGFARRLKTLHDKGVTILVFQAAICDSPQFIRNYLGSHISKIYTDTWSPLDPAPET